jgi:preprotein translocase subunit SecD
MDAKRLMAFIAAVIITLAAVGLTSPGLLKNQRLGLDLKGGFEILYEASPIDEGQPMTKESLIQTARSLEERANALKVAEPEVVPEGSNRIRVRIAGVTNAEEVRAIMKKPADLTFRGPDGKKELLGSDFKEGAAQVVFNSANQPIIQIEVKDKEKLREVSQRLLGQPLAIYLDENMLSAPVVQSVLPDGNATITGSYTYDEAKELAQVINLGALPLKLTEKYTVSVGATLGQLSLDQTVRAAAYGTILILLFMLVMYRVPGFVACVTLIAYIWLLLGTFYLLNATITLPGIAAFVLGIGMAVDANIITYERIKEEIRSGKTILSSLKAGSKNSFSTIMDANITTIIAGLVLYWLGNGAIQGFALTLILSIVLSIATNVFFSRFLLHLLIRAGAFKKSSYYGVKESEISAL